MSDFKNYIVFLNSLDFLVQFITIVKSHEHACTTLPGWQGIETLTCLNENNDFYDVDIRYAWSNKIFRQNFIDYIEAENNLFYQKKSHSNRHKLVIYLCDSSININDRRKIQVVPKNCLITQYWQSVHHLYLLLPKFHPFSLPKKLDSDTIASLDKYATTRYLNNNDNCNEPKTNSKAVLSSSSYLESRQEGGLRIRGQLKIASVETPLVTIITVVFNGEKYLEQTIQSVLNQSYPNIEYLIIDGGSTDKTLAIIRKYESNINYWLSEPDRGVYDAMNKGWNMANNDSYILFLGAGDVVINIPEINEESKTIIFGRVFMGETGIYRASTGFRMKFGNTLHHQALLIHKSWCKTIPFNPTYKIYGDYDFNARLLKQGAQFVFKQDFMAYALPGGLSRKIYIRELLKIIKNNYGMFWMLLAAIYYFYQGIRYGFKRISVER